MAVSKYSFSEAKYKKWIKEGRGQGSQSRYKPWLTVRDVPSEGRSHRIFGYKSQRIHHLLSDLEAAVFLLLEWNHKVIEIREQFPLKREDTLQIATDIGASHPKEKSLMLYMSSDLLVDTTDKDLPQFVLQAKYSDALNDERTIEKLDIEQQYWLQKQIPWYLVTEEQISKEVLANIKWLTPAQSDEIDDNTLLERMEFYSRQFQLNEKLKLVDICKKIDTAYSQQPGASLLEVRQLLAKRFFQFDIFQPVYKLCGCDFKAGEMTQIEKALHVSNQ